MALVVLLTTVGYVPSYRPPPVVGLHVCQMMAEQQPPLGLRVLTREELLDKLNAVPVFSVVNGAQQMLATPDETSGAPFCRFYLDVSEAQAALAELRAANPRVLIELAVTPLGTAYALSEWGDVDDVEAGGVAGSGLSSRADDDDVLDDDWDDDGLDDEYLGDGSSGGRPEVAVRLQAAQAEVDSVGDVLGRSPVPPLLRRRNAREGPVPLFGSDLLRFQLPADAASDADSTDASMVPLFFQRADFETAWAASGGAPEKRPAAQVTDLRTLAWQMQFDPNQDWRPMLFVAPEAALDFVKEQQQIAAAQAAAAAQPVELSPADAQGLIFGEGEQLPNSY